MREQSLKSRRIIGRLQAIQTARGTGGGQDINSPLEEEDVRWHDGIERKTYYIPKDIRKQEDDADFISFLAFCADRLNKGEQVQSIWLDYLELAR